MATEQPRTADTSDVGAELEELGVPHPGLRGAEAASAALRVLAHVQMCAGHGGERGEAFDRAEFLRRVAAHLNGTVAQADAIARAVFAAMRRRLPGKEVHDVASQLPRNLEALWTSASPA